MDTLFDYIAEKLPILKYCCCIICLVTLLSFFPFYNIAEAYFFFLLCWDVLNLETLLMYTLTCYIAELFSILKHCWWIRCLIWKAPNLEIFLLYYLSCYIAELFPSYNIAEAYFILLLCWDVLNLETLTCYNAELQLLTLLKSSQSWNIAQSCYIAELFPILCWGILYVITLLRCSQSWNIADVYPDLLHCWTVLNLKTLLMDTLFDYIAEKLPILKNCCLVTLLSFFPSYNIAEAYFILLLLRRSQSWNTADVYVVTLLGCSLLKHCWWIRCLITLLKSS